MPQAMRAALLPLLGERRDRPEAFAEQMNRSLDFCLALLPYGLYGGAAVVWLILPLAFPAQYTDGSLAGSAVELFMILLFGWCCTLLATPTYTALQAGSKPWHFTAFIGAVVAFAALVGSTLITWQADFSDQRGILAAAIASSITAAFMLLLSLRMAGPEGYVRHRLNEWGAALGLALATCIGLVAFLPLAFVGLGLFLFTPKGLAALRPTEP